MRKLLEIRYGESISEWEIEDPAFLEHIRLLEPECERVLGRDTLNSILAFTRRNGLLGILPHQTSYVRSAEWGVRGFGHHRVDYVRSGGEWLAMSVEVGGRMGHTGKFT